MAVNLVERPNLYPGVTPLLRRTTGPVAYLGEVITGVHVFLGETEANETIHAFGGLSKLEKEELLATIAGLEERIERYEDEISATREFSKAGEKLYRVNRARLSAARTKSSA